MHYVELRYVNFITAGGARVYPIYSWDVINDTVWRKKFSEIMQSIHGLVIVGNSSLFF